LKSSSWMLIDIFSNFDPIWFSLCYKNLIAVATPPIIILRILWLKKNKIIIGLIPIISYVSNQLILTKLKHIKIILSITRRIFILIVFINIIGIMPYLFRITSHILFTLSMGLPIWILLIIRSATFLTKNFIAHLLPNSAPIWLSPFLVLVELTRILVRPLTLSFRLAANITAGHVIINLIFIYSISYIIKTFLLIRIISRIYLIFELTICMIQAYIFCLLLSLYANDHR